MFILVFPVCIFLTLGHVIKILMPHVLPSWMKMLCSSGEINVVVKVSQNDQSVG